MLKKILLITLFISGIANAFEIKRTSSETQVYVFGIPGTQPPTRDSVKTIRVDFGATSKQVCGYTDWSTTIATLPNKILSGKYWEGIATDVLKEVEDTAMAIAGALPSMLACNVSPTFCSVMNNAKLLSQFEFGYTVKACDVLEGLGDHLIFDEKLKSCMEKSSNDSSKQPGQRREKCIKELAGDSSDKKFEMFKYDEFLNTICPGSVIGVNKSDFFYGNRKIYSRHERTCKFLQEIFPGVEIFASNRTIREGTFQGTVEEVFRNILAETVDSVVSAVKEINDERSTSAKRPHEIIGKFAEKWEKENKVKDTNPDEKTHQKGFMRSSNDNFNGDFLIPPEQIFQFSLLLNDREDPSAAYKKRGSAFRVAVDRAARSASHIKMLDNLGDSLNVVQTGCLGNSKLQNPMAKENCQYLTGHLQSEISLLNTRIQTERELIRSQEEITKLVSEELSRRERKPLKQNAPLDVDQGGPSGLP